MQTAPCPDTDEIRDNATFAALMWALARPGSAKSLPQPGMAAVALALCDRECRVQADDPALAALLASTGAALVPAPLADHVFAATAPDLATLRVGSALYPDDGATLILAATLGTGLPLRLTGPGIDGTLIAPVGGPGAGFWAARAAVCRYPLGIDIFLIDGARVMGLPRSTLIEVP